MERKITKNLLNWFHQDNRKPLLIKGARQVGKTWVVRNLAKKLNLEILELNFERNFKLKTLFADNDPQKTILQLETLFNKTIHVEKTLLFLDEIQAAPELLAKLRWFAEEKPELAVIATGSLLDFALEEHEFSMPVGRINYMHLEPMSFAEFLLAEEQEKLYEFLENFTLESEIPDAIHERLWQFLKYYILVGGMPAAVNNWIEKKSFIEINEIQQNILQTYKDDFSKYAKRVSNELLEDIFQGIPKLLGKKFKYTTINKDIRAQSLKKALLLLCKARVCHKVMNTSANGIPLGGEIRENIFKVIFLDVGLATAEMGLSLLNIDSLNDLHLINEGGITEQVVGQLLRSITPYYVDPQLYYWLREKTGSEAEVDYLLQYNMQIIPVEVKAGTTGKLRSLHAFMNAKKLKKAVRINADKPSLTEVKVRNHAGELVEYQLLSLPLYLVEQIYRFL